MPNNVTAQLVWDFGSEPLGGLLAGLISPAVPLEPGINPFIYHANGCAVSNSASIATQEAFSDGDGHGLNMQSIPAGPNVHQPGAGKAIRLDTPPLSTTAQTFDFRIKFRVSSDPSLKYTLDVYDAVFPELWWTIVVTRFYLEITYQGIFFPVTERATFATELAMDEWHAIRVCFSNDALFPMYGFVNGTLVLRHDRLIGAPETVHLQHWVYIDVPYVGQVAIDRFAIIFHPQKVSYPPSTTAQFFYFDELDEPVYDVTPESLIADVADGVVWNHVITGGTGPYTVVLYDGSFPPGVSMDSLGNVFGNYEGPGVYDVVIKTIDSLGAYVLTELTFQISEPVPPQYVEVQSLSVEFLYNAVNDNFRATISGLLYSNVPIADAEIIPLYSVSGSPNRFRECVPGGTSPTTGLSASPTGVSFDFEWDFRDAVPSASAQETVYVTVIARSVSIGTNSYQDPAVPLITETVGPEQEDTEIIPDNPDLTVVEGTELIGSQLVNRDSETINVDVEYSRDGGETWDDCTEGIGGDGKENLPTTPTGVDYIFAWDTLADNVRGAKVLFRVTPKKKARRSPTVYADFRFEDRVVGAWDFGTGAGTVPVVAGDLNSLPMLYGDGRGNRFADYDGTVEEEAARLKLECDAGLRAAVGFPVVGLADFSDTARGFFMDFVFNLGTVDSLTMEVRGPGSVLLASVKITPTDMEVQVVVGAVAYVLRNTTTHTPATQYTGRFTLTPNDDGAIVSYVRNTLPIGFVIDPADPPVQNVQLPKAPALFSESELYVRAVAEGANGTMAYVHRVVLQDENQFTGAHILPTSDDPCTGTWLKGDWWPLSEGEHLIGCTANTADYGTSAGAHGRSLALTGNLEMPSPTAGKQRIFRFDLMKHGFGLELHTKIPSGDLSIKIQKGIPYQALELLLGLNTGIIQATVYDEFGVPFLLEYPYSGANWHPDPATWHHFRFSVRRTPDYTAAISVDGSKPTFLVIPSLPRVFVPELTPPVGLQILFDLVGFVGPAPVEIDDLKIWDGYHMSPYPVPIPEEPQTDYWKP